LAYTVADRGACHLRTTFYKPELSGMIEPDRTEGKVDMFLDFEDRLTLFDTLILCRFFRDLIQWDELSTLIQGTTGMKLNQRDLKRIASHVTDATRLFNLREGLTREDDSLPEPFFARKLSKGGHGITRETLSQMVKDYYRLRGWDENGVPASFEK